jgi:hypothetical protein
MAKKPQERNPKTGAECEPGDIIRTPDGRRLIVMSLLERVGLMCRLWLGDRADHGPGPFAVPLDAPVSYLGRDKDGDERQAAVAARGNQKNPDPVQW